MLELRYSTGVGGGERLALNVTDVDLDNPTAVVLGKGNKQRVVPIGKTIEYLKATHARCHPREREKPA